MLDVENRFFFQGFSEDKQFNRFDWNIFFFMLLKLNVDISILYKEKVSRKVWNFMVYVLQWN